MLAATLESTADGILVVDRTGRITSWNSRFAEMWQVPPGLFAEHDDHSALASLLEQLLRSRRVRRQGPRGLRRAGVDQSRHARVQGRPGARAGLAPPAHRRRGRGTRVELPRRHRAPPSPERAHPPGLPRPVDRAREQGAVPRPRRPRGHPAPTSRRAARGAVHRPRRLQDRQRQPRPLGRRLAAPSRERPALEMRPRRRHGGPARRRRVRGADGRARRPQRRDRRGRTNHRRPPGARRARRVARVGDGEHRHRVRIGGRRIRRDAPQRRPRDVHGEGRRQELLPRVRPRDAPRRGRTPRPRSASSRRGRARRAGGPLPADLRAAVGPHRGLRITRALAPPRARAAQSAVVHPVRRGDRAHRRDRPPRARDGMRGSGPVDRHRRERGRTGSQRQRRAPPTPRRASARPGGIAARPVPARSAATDPRDHRRRADEGPGRGDRRAPPVERPRRAARRRRLRHGLLVARLPAAVPDRPAQDRRLVRERHPEPIGIAARTGHRADLAHPRARARRRGRRELRAVGSALGVRMRPRAGISPRPAGRRGVDPGAPHGAAPGARLRCRRARHLRVTGSSAPADSRGLESSSLGR